MKYQSEGGGLFCEERFQTKKIPKMFSNFLIIDLGGFISATTLHYEESSSKSFTPKSV